MQTFEAILIKDTKPVYYTRIYTPFSVQEVWGVKISLPVLVTLDGIPFKGTLMPAGNNQHSLIVSGIMQKKIGKTVGDMVSVTIEKDETPRETIVPEDFDNALENSPLAKAFFFEILSPSRQRGLIKYINDAKTVETRLDRIEKLCSKMAEKQFNGEKSGKSIFYEG